MKKEDSWYKIYGTVNDIYVGQIDKNNLKESETILDAANGALLPRGITATRFEKRKEFPEVEYRNLGVKATFLYSDNDYFELINVANMPCIKITESSKTKGDYTAIGFGDLHVAEELLEKVLRVVEYLKNQEQQEGGE